LQRFPSRRANASEPERTPNLAILATESGAEPGLGELLGDLLTRARTRADPQDGGQDLATTASSMKVTVSV
jgi:hypothetical protein